MANVQSNYALLIDKLDQFIRKYYVNQLIRGGLYAVGLVLGLFVLFNVLEYFFYFSTGVRKGMFWTFVLTSAGALVWWVLLPLLHYFRLGRVISHRQAASIIGSHFTSVQDKLLNILQLNEQAVGVADASLIRASVDQKIEELRPVPFKAAIDLNKNRRYLRYALPPLLVLLALLIGAPNMITTSTRRLIRNNEETVRPELFQFVVDVDSLRVVQFSDFKLDVGIAGEALPNEVFVEVNNYQYKLDKLDAANFSYVFNKVNQDTKFRLIAAGASPKEYVLTVVKKPNIRGFDVTLDYPSYIGRKDEVLNNTGDLVLPEGTKVLWTFEAEHTNEIAFRLNGADSMKLATKQSEDNFTYRLTAVKDVLYTLYISNENLYRKDSVAYTISVVPDLHPTISVQVFPDSLDKQVMYFVGDASDDYGLRSLNFVYQVENEGTKSAVNTLPVSFDAGKATQYTYTFDVNALHLKPGDKLTYFFEVFDNDGIRGSKSARTGIFTFAVPTKEEYQKLENENNKAIKNDLNKSIDEMDELQKELQEMRDKLLQKKELNWQDKKDLENLMNKQKQLQEKMQQAQQAFQENMKQQEQFQQPSEELKQKQEQLQKLFDSMMDEEMKRLMEKFKDKMEEMSRDETIQQLEEMDLNNEEFQKEMERMKELFKEMELEDKIEEAANKLDSLAQKEEKLSEKTEQKKESKEELKKEQDKLNKEFEELKKDMKDIEKKNQELQNPKDLDKMEDEQEEIQEEMENSSDDLQKNDNNNASKKQKNASKKMKSMSDKMKAGLQQAQMEQMEENMEMLKQLLENLVTVSFDQEHTMKEIGEVNTNTPRYTELVQNQYKLKDDFKVIEDSLQELSKRVFQLAPFINEKVTDVKASIRKSIELLEDRNKNEAIVKQQYTMTYLNDLALMLSESMEQMQQQMAQSMPGNQMCQKPGGKGQGKGQGKMMQRLGDMQQQLNDKMTKQGEKAKQGDKGKPGQNGQPSSRDFAEMAAQQAAIRRALQELQQKLQEQGKGDQGLQDLLNQMDKTETDLVNKRLTEEMLKRQKEILTRLLESEKAMREQDMDEKRESKTAQQQERKMPPALEEYLKKHQSDIEMYQSVSPSLKPYFKSLVQEYFNSLKKQ